MVDVLSTSRASCYFVSPHHVRDNVGTNVNVQNENNDESRMERDE